MRKVAVLFVFMFLMVVLIGLLMSQSLVVMQRIAHVSNTTGPIQVKSGDQQHYHALGEATHVAAGDTLSTGPTGTLMLNWIDGTRIKMGPNTILTVLKCQLNRSTQAQTSLFKLDAGQIWIRILKTLSQQSKFEVRTPTATAGVRGTIFSIKVTPEGDTQVSVYDGSVLVQTDQGSSIEVAPHRLAQLSGAETAGRLAEFSTDDYQQWEASLQDLGPYLQITRPRLDETFSGESVRVTGICEQGATLTINGKPITPRPNGQFSIHIPVPAAQQVFTVRAVATDVNGQTTTIIRPVQRLGAVAK